MIYLYLWAFAIFVITAFIIEMLVMLNSQPDLKLK